MYKHIGEKIEALAAAICIIGMIISVVYCLIIHKTILGMLLGLFVSWISTFVLFGFGYIICTLEDISAKMTELVNNTSEMSVETRREIQKIRQEKYQIQTENNNGIKS